MLKNFIIKLPIIESVIVNYFPSNCYRLAYHEYYVLPSGKIIILLVRTTVNETEQNFPNLRSIYISNYSFLDLKKCQLKPWCF